MNNVEKIRQLDVADAYLLTSDINVRYAAGFSGDSSELLITQDIAVLFTDARYTLQAQKDLGEGVEVVTTTAGERLSKLAHAIRRVGAGTLGLEKDSLSANAFAEYANTFRINESVDVSEKLLRLREMKTPEEIGNIEIAARANDVVLENLLPRIQAGISELDVRAELVYQINRQGMDSAFAPIVAAGLNSAIPHATVSGNVLKPGDFLTLDFGCKYNGYCSDITRTFGIGDIDAKLKKIYDIVKIAQQNAMDVASHAKTAPEIDAAARGTIEKAGYAEYFAHGTGHGVGLQIHELPVINARAQDVLCDGMVYTIEPGIYMPGLGGVRIEDTYVHGKGGLNKFSKELILIQ